MPQTKIERERIIDAYLQMARDARYRPAAPSDGFGGITISNDELSDPARLATEAETYARRFIAEEDTLSFWIGCSNYSTNRAFVFTIEAARSLSGAADNDLIITLLKMAIKEIEASRKAKATR